MNLKLCAIKNGNEPLNRVQIVVVDLDRSHHYPLNFVCVLPRYFRLLEKRSSKFAKLFGERSFSVAKNLLVDASRSEDAPEIRTVIDKRLKAIQKEDGDQTRQQLP